MTFSQKEYNVINVKKILFDYIYIRETQKRLKKYTTKKLLSVKYFVTQIFLYLTTIQTPTTKLSTILFFFPLRGGHI